MNTMVTAAKDGIDGEAGQSHKQEHQDSVLRGHIELLGSSIHSLMLVGRSYSGLGAGQSSDYAWVMSQREGPAIARRFTGPQDQGVHEERGDILSRALRAFDQLSEFTPPKLRERPARLSESGRWADLAVGEKDGFSDTIGCIGRTPAKLRV